MSERIRSEILTLLVEARFAKFCNAHPALKKKQIAILADLFGPLDNKEIAKKHDMSVNSLRFHLKKVYLATNTNSRQELIHKMFPEIHESMIQDNS